jgi:hypothetical protein
MIRRHALTGGIIAACVALELVLNMAKNPQHRYRLRLSLTVSIKRDSNGMLP